MSHEGSPLKITADIKVNIDEAGVTKLVEEATRLGLRDTIVAMANFAVKKSPALTGNNRRSLHYEVSGMGGARQTAGGRQSGDTWETPSGRVVDDSKLEAALYSTSGYGGTLEVGSSRMSARPYIRPALDRHGKELAPNIRKHMK